METKELTIAPGTRLRIRGEEWLVRRVDRTSGGQRRISVLGLSPLVRNRDALFLDSLEDDLEVVDPARTVPVPDASAHYRDARLHLEFLLRDTTPSDERIHLGHRAAMDVVPYQLDPAFLSLGQPRQRILIADAVGLGKTIECGVLLTELIRRGRGRRILVLAVKSMLTQFQKELWARFAIPLTRMDSAALQRIRTRIPANHNPFHYFDKTIVSIDTVKQDGEYRNYLESAWWDVIVIDEAHNVAQRGGGGAQRHRVAKLLAERSDSLILLSATPHDGKKESFASIMNMLNPTAIKDPKNYGPADIEGLFIRRFKKDIKDQVKGAFPQRVTHTEFTEASGPEEAAYDELAALRLTELDQRRSGNILFKTLLEKSLFSSPAACNETIETRLRSIDKRDDAARYAADSAALRRLAARLDAIDVRAFSKFQLLVDLLGSGPKSIGWNPKDGDDRLVIFTERIATLHWLHVHLPTALKLKPAQVAILHGGLSDLEQQEVVEAFGVEDSKVRLLIASDVASEGINLHYLSHRLIHFDIPWSLLTFQQRNGRVDRYGQTRQPQLHYLLTESANATIRGDQRILEILIEKDRQVQENIGDPSEFTGMHSAEEEERRVAAAIESGESPEQFERAYGGIRPEDSEDPFLAALFGQLPQGESARKDSDPLAEMTASIPSLFPDDYAWAKAALDYARSQLGQSLQLEYLDDRREIHLTLPEDFRARTKRLPREIFDHAEQCILTTNREAVMNEIAACRKEEGRWPRLQLLWELHPVMRWLHDKVIGAFGKSEAPVIALPTLTRERVIVLCSGILPNRKGHPLIQRWVGVSFEGGQAPAILTLEDVLAQTRFGREAYPNPGTPGDLAAIAPRIPEAVACVRKEMGRAKIEVDQHHAPELAKQLERLKAFKDEREHQLELRFEKMDHVKQAEQRKIRDLHAQYSAWIRDTLETENNPSIQVAAIFTGTAPAS